MKDREDYYQILGISLDADEGEISRAYEHKIRMLHTERSKDAARHVRYFAERDLEKVRRAYHVLSDPVKKQKYDRERSRRIPDKDESGIRSMAPAPNPQVDPAVIRFDNVEPYVTQTGSFVVSNTGGPYDKLIIGEPPQWIRIVQAIPSSYSSEVPMQVLFEAVGLHWGTIQTGDIAVALDDAETRVTIKLRTREKPGEEESSYAATPPAEASVGGGKGPHGRKPPAERHKKKGSPWRNISIAILILILAGAAGYAIFHYTSSDTSPEPTPTPTLTPEPETLYSEGKSEIRLALDIYLAEHGGQLPLGGGTVTLTDPAGEFPILNMCTLSSPYEALRDVPDSCIDIYGIINDNCDGGICKCSVAGHYIWLVDSAGNVLSTCIGEECAANSADGYQDVWP